MTHSSGRASPRAWFAVAALGVGSFSIVTAELAPIGLLSPIASDLGVTNTAILDGHPRSRIEDLMPWCYAQASSLAA